MLRNLHVAWKSCQRNVARTTYASRRSALAMNRDRCQYVFHWFLSGPEPVYTALQHPLGGRCTNGEVSMQIRVLASISIFVAVAANADSTEDALAEIARCAGIGDPSARLKCFDTAAPHANSVLAGQQAKE